jgi:putative NIF3 family GTP cyclohydrolase 1 type 2
VHHGLFWRGQDGPVTGWMKQRLARLLAHDINLFAYHLPLDAHHAAGQQRAAGLRLGLVRPRAASASRIWASSAGGTDGEASGPALAACAGLPGRAPVLLPGDGRPLQRVAWCTGGAQGYFEAAIAAGADAFITGEISEPQAHLARETGVAYLACGHHATERYGAPAVAAWVAATVRPVEHRSSRSTNPA